MAEPIPVAVVGVGYLGRFHAQKYRSLNQCKLVGVVDTDPARARLVAGELGVECFTDLDSVLPRVAALSVAVPTPDHRTVVRRCLNEGKAVLVEKPLAATTAEAAELADLAQRRGLILQVGHLERFNPAFRAVASSIENPQFIESVRIASFKERGSDVDVVMDLMSHDLDLVLSMVRAPLMNLHAVGISVMTTRTDLANARLIFATGCVANLTASRISTKVERKLRIFQADGYFSLDLAEPSARIFRRVAPGGDIPKRDSGAMSAGGLPVWEERPTLGSGDALLVEIEAFVEAVKTGSAPLVGGREGLSAIELAERIIADISRNRLP